MKRLLWEQDSSRLAADPVFFFYFYKFSENFSTNLSFLVSFHLISINMYQTYIAEMVGDISGNTKGNKVDGYILFLWNDIDTYDMLFLTLVISFNL